MRVALLAPLVAPLREAQLGGAHAFTSDLARALAASGDEVAVVCARGSEMPGLELLQVEVPAEVAAARVVPAGGTVRAPRAALEVFVRAFELAREWGASVVSQHAFDAEAFEAAALTAMPALHTLHLLPSTSPRVRAAAVSSGQPLVTVSHWSAAAWAQAGAAGFVIPNGVPDFDPPAAAVRPRAVIAGRVSPEKGTHRAVALAAAAGLEALVVGEVYDHGYARAHGISARPVPRAELWAAMAASAVTLMPVDWDEPFGLVAAESMVAGCPVVAYARGALPEVVGDGGVLVAPGDEEAFAAAIPTALGLDRGRIRASARERLLIDRCVEPYRAALAAAIA